jgi:hypothetical protein
MKEIISYITLAQKNLKTLPFTEHVGFLWFCPDWDCRVFDLADFYETFW